ncbi:MAG: competence/damage-inducible protein A [Acidimicrobiales bacterium]
MSLRCEVLAVGTELLLGQIVDTNSAWIGEQLALSGIDSLLQTKVGDNHARIVAALRAALERADALIVCGGLGPTHDDITREAIAEVMGAELVIDDDIVERIKEMFASRQRAMPEINVRQAMVPTGATVIEQRRGTAPGLICPVGDKVVYAVPGVPHEMREMLERAVLPDLRHRSGETAAIVSRTLRTWGQSESGLNEMLADYIDELERARGTTLAFLASGIEGLKVRLTAKAPNAAAAIAVLDEQEARLRVLLGALVFGVDDDTMESVVLQLLRDRGLTLGLAESLTGGLVAARLTDIAGASDVLRGSIVSYSSDVKFDVLGVPRGPVVSAETAMAMAQAAQRVLGADVGVSLTGVAGPTEQDGQPVGTVFIGLAIRDKVTMQQVRLPGTRDQVRQFAVITALNALRLTLMTS